MTWVLLAVLAVVALVILLRGPWREWRRRREERARDRKRAERRERRASREQGNPDRALNKAKVAARTGGPTWQQVAARQGRKCWLCGRGTHEDDRERQRDGSTRYGAAYPCVVFEVPIDQGGTYEVGNSRLAHRHCAALRESNPGRTQYGAPKRTYPA